MAKEYIRRAHHAGSWYEDDAQTLDRIIQSYLHDASVLENEESSSQEGIPRGVIAPHAGYVYSGPTAAHAYKHLREALRRGWKGTVVVLHPSHHVYIDGCAVSNAHTIETPIASLPVDANLREELLQGSQEFTTMTQRTDEMEHSGEMQYPFIASILKHFYDNDQHRSTSSISKAGTSSDTDGRPIVQVLPIMIGSTSQTKRYGHLLSSILSRPNIFTVISSDFCHWGSRFGYSPTPPNNHNSSRLFTSNTSSTSNTSNTNNTHTTTNINKTTIQFNEIHEFIEWLDRQGMEHISLQDPGAFAAYMKQYKNTICGRYPIALYLNALTHAKDNGLEQVRIVFVKYDQSSRVKRMNESSVSYASAVARKIG